MLPSRLVSVSKQSVPAALPGRRWCSGGSRGYLARTLRQGASDRGGALKGPLPLPQEDPRVPPSPRTLLFSFSRESLLCLLSLGKDHVLIWSLVLCSGASRLSADIKCNDTHLLRQPPALVPADNSRRHTSECTCVHTHTHTHTAHGVWQMRLASGSLRIRCRWLIHARRQL